jgi:hypothetical protein
MSLGARRAIARGRLAAALLATALACLAGPPPVRAAEPTIYKWVDEHGVAHYTTDRGRIPASIRDRVVDSPGSDAAREDWLLRDAREAPPTPAATPEAAAAPEAPAPAPASAAVGEPGDAVHAVPIEAPYSEAPGAEAVAEPELAPPAAEPPEAASARSALEEPPAPAPVAAPPRDAETTAALGQLDGQIAALEGEIARDEEALMQLISATEGERKGPIVDDPKFREIAQRLPRLQADLEALRERRGSIEPTPVRP